MLGRVEIIEEVLNQAFAEFGRKVKNQLTGTYTKRE
jgi:hypothetical protein